jgi:hypothetical protein
MKKNISCFGNTGSVHPAGRKASIAVLSVLLTVLILLQCSCSILFPEDTSSEEQSEETRRDTEARQESSGMETNVPILSDPATIEDVESKLTELYGLTDFDIVSITVDTVDNPDRAGSIMDILVICHANGEETSWVESYGISYSAFLSLYQLNDSGTVYDWTDPYTVVPLEAWGLILSIINE